MQRPSSAAESVGPWPWEGMTAAQQPQWQDHAAYPEVCQALAAAPPLVTAAEIGLLRRSLSVVPDAGALLLHMGDCAESFYECSAPHVAGKLRLADRLAERLGDLTGRGVLRVGRMAGQFAKPRSQATERRGDLVLPSFRGHMINAEVATSQARRANPRRMLWAYTASDTVQRAMRAHHGGPGRRRAGHRPWSSHEALVLDYETRLVRRDPASGALYLSSTHLPWVGERTRDPDGPHVTLLSRVDNPVGCKIGPGAAPDDVLRLCERLDPGRVPGRLVLIPRMGRDAVGEALAPIVRAVAAAGHPVIWLSDPMHGNTVVSRSGLKTRHLSDVIDEALAFRDIVGDCGEHPAGLHIEVAADDVTECVGGAVESEDDLHHRYTTLCDPRLNADQATELVEAWAKGSAARP